MKLYRNRVGETIGSLCVMTILRYQDNAPVYECKCLECGAINAIPHRLFQLRNAAKCKSSFCGRPQITTAGPTLGSVHVRENNRITWAEWREQQPKEQPDEQARPADSEQQKQQREYREGVLKMMARIGIS